MSQTAQISPFSPTPLPPPHFNPGDHTSVGGFHHPALEQRRMSLPPPPPEFAAPATPTSDWPHLMHSQPWLDSNDQGAPKSPRRRGNRGDSEATQPLLRGQHESSV